MKLKKLIIDNIASIEHAEIDFSASPLADERLFLISGETGSGKSTIIDCLCLALYGTTPRLKGAKAAKYDVSVAGSDKEEQITTTNPKQLMRRGSVSANVELTFDDNDDVPYIATWEVHRARNRIDGRLMEATRTLRTADDVIHAVHLSKSTEIEQHVEKLIGLNVDQFFRTVVLAQGKFAEFLDSGEREKSELLEKMTGTEIYSQVGKKIYEVCQQKATHCSNLKIQMENIHLLSDEQKTTINEDLQRSAHEHTVVDGQLKRALAMQQWLNDKNRLESDISKRTVTLGEKTAISRSADYMARQALLNDWETTADARHCLREKQDALRLIDKLQELHPVIQEQFDGLCAALRATVADIADKQRQVDALDDYLAREEPNKPMYEAMEQIKSLMKRWRQSNKDVAEYTWDLDKDKEKLPAAQELLQRTQDNVKGLEQGIRALQKQHDGLNLAAITREKDLLSQTIRALETLKDKHDAVEGSSQTLDKLKGQLAQAEQTIARVNATLDAKRALRDKAKESVERQTGWNELLIQAQEKVREGDQCPVCGNTITHLLVPKAESELETLRQEYRQAEDDLQQAEGQIKVNEQLVSNYNKQIVEAAGALEKKIGERENHWQQTIQLLDQCGRPAGEMPDKQHADTFIADIGAQVEQLNTKLETATALNRQIQAEQQKLTAAREEHHQAGLALNTLSESNRNQAKLVQKTKEDIISLEGDLNALLVMPDWKECDGTENDFIGRLQRAADEYQKSVSSRQQLARIIELRTAAIPAMEQSRANMQGLTDHGHKTDVVPDDLDGQWHALERRHVELKAQLNAARESAAKAQQALEAHLSTLPAISMERVAELCRHNQAEMTGIKQEHEQLNNDITAMKGAIDSLAKQLADLKTRKPDFNEENPDRLEEIIAERQAKLEELTTHIAELKAQLAADEENAKRMGSQAEELERAEAEYRQWNQLNSILGSADGATFRKIAQSYILGDLLVSANGYLRHFNNRYTLEARPGTLIILVRDLIQGDLTSVNTLSGGEIFMVSLALALALSNMAGKMFTVDTLFIDEGFGSLSPTYLDNVMETLNRLYDMGGRRVGIISHMEMLKERVSTQIRVFRAPDNNTVSLVEVTS